MEQRIGPANDRELGALALDIARAAPTHDLLAEAQLVAWLFTSALRARTTFSRSLAELRADEVDAPAVLARVANRPAAELIHCAVALEASSHARLPKPEIERGFDDALALVRPAAPALATLPIIHVRALRRHGRLYNARIWVGLPGAAEARVEPSFIAWQAAHEATVAELVPSRLRFAEHEHAAVALLAERAKRCGLEREHRAWLDQLRAPPSSIASLTAPLRTIVEAALERSGT
ncbi:hypothetical protein BH09MYX1_BH09MYX1_38460 [soil metagenome]